MLLEIQRLNNRGERITDIILKSPDNMSGSQVRTIIRMAEDKYSDYSSTGDLVDELIDDKGFTYQSAAALTVGFTNL